MTCETPTGERRCHWRVGVWYIPTTLLDKEKWCSEHLPAAAQGDDMERRLKDLPEWVLSVTNNLLLHRSWRQGASGRCGARPGFLCVQETTAQQHIANKTYQSPIPIAHSAIAVITTQRSQVSEVHSRYHNSKFSSQGVNTAQHLSTAVVIAEQKNWPN